VFNASLHLGGAVLVILFVSACGASRALVSCVYCEDARQYSRARKWGCKEVLFREEIVTEMDLDRALDIDAMSTRTRL
jgi:hypothetical protein